MSVWQILLMARDVSLMQIVGQMNSAVACHVLSQKSANTSLALTLTIEVVRKAFCISETAIVSPMYLSDLRGSLYRGGLPLCSHKSI